MGTAEVGLVMLGNIILDGHHRPMNEEAGLFKEIPNIFQETAFIDRIHGRVAGWEMTRVTKDTPSRSLGFKGDFLAEYVSQEMRLVNSNDLRDRKAITRLATGS